MKQKKNSHSTERRDFIKKASIASLGISIVPRHVLGGVGFTAPSDKLVVA
ncbi:MAG TPA: oxidoreductase, partial [Maribacter sp.]|nr:oxidoreductase [Maribacter sp.]